MADKLVDRDSSIPETTISEDQNESRPFPVVGIGASAGGLEAYEALFRAMPTSSGMAFVLVQHLDPNHSSILSELIQRFTAMPVAQIQDQTVVEPDHIYIIPPNHDLELANGTLSLVEAPTHRGLRLPIDFFFKSLAADLHEQAICIILSGTGSDGTLGLRAIKGEGGMVMVQDPASAKYDGMPRNAIATDLVDYILPVEKIPGQLIEFARSLLLPKTRDPSPLPVTDSAALAQILALLRAETGHDFSQYKENTIRRRIERLMAIHQIETMKDYAKFLTRNTLGLEILFREMNIGVTSFFRDKAVFKSLATNVIPHLIERQQANQPLRIWVPACSTGEEAYSIAILLMSQMTTLQRQPDVQLFATDIDDRAINFARVGVYPVNIVADVAPEYLQRFFTLTSGGENYRVIKSVRDMLVFATHSLIKDPPFSRLDLISCRNLLIYLNPELQRKVLALFHYALAPGGYLLLGNSESLGKNEYLFTPIDGPHKLFQRLEADRTERTVIHFPSFSREPESPARIELMPVKRPPISQFIEQMLLAQETPVCIATNWQGQILYVHGRSGKYLELAGIDTANLDVVRMAREGLQGPLNALIYNAMAQKEAVTQSNIQVKTNGDFEAVTVTVRPLIDTEYGENLIVILIRESPALAVSKDTETSADDVKDQNQQVTQLTQELKDTKEYLQAIIEELKSSNEEAQSMNEELQSVNEELETSQEELKSVNEELLTINAELESKINEVTWTNNDLDNTLNSITVALVLLDSEFNIRRFNPAATKIFNLIAGDNGRPITHVVSNLVYPEFVQHIHQVFESLIPIETDVYTTDSHWYSVNIRPYRTLQHAIKGVVISFIDITEVKAEQERHHQFEQVAELSSNLVVFADAQGLIQYANPRFLSVTGFSLAEAKQHSILASGDTDTIRELVSSGNRWTGEAILTRKDGPAVRERGSIVPTRSPNGEIAQFIKVTELVPDPGEHP